MTLVHAICVALGAAAGGVGRYALTQALRSVGPQPGEAPGTTAANVLGSFLLGWLAHLLLAGALQPTPYALLGIGFCGALSTWSTLAKGVAQRALDGDHLGAGGYLAANLVLGLVAVNLGWQLGG